MIQQLFDLTGKVALITGGTHGIGMAIGKVLGQAGAKICVNDISDEKLESCKTEYAEAGITVNGIAPAVIRTPMNEKTAPEQLKYLTERIPMHRLGTVEEAASLACWIVSEEASFTTGFIFDLSGGRATY